jgi:hypothetical protein
MKIPLSTTKRVMTFATKVMLWAEKFYVKTTVYVRRFFPKNK